MGCYAATKPRLCRRVIADKLSQPQLAWPRMQGSNENRTTHVAHHRDYVSRTDGWRKPYVSTRSGSV